MMKTLAHLFHIFLLTAFIFLSCGDNNDDDNFYDDWTVTGSGLTAEVS